MTPEDFAALHAKAFRSTRAWTASEFKDLLAHKTVHWCGDTSCFILIRVVMDEAEVLTIATNPAQRRQGLASKPLMQGENLAKAQGATSVLLEVGENNTAARALYAKHGYAQIGTRPGYYMPKDSAPITAFVLRKDLSST